jgi:hypothetical protein
MNKFFGWFDNFRMMMLCLLLAFACHVYLTINEHLHPPELKEFKGGIQNHLVWNIQKECYFVRPTNGQTVYLIKVEDCNK